MHMHVIAITLWLKTPRLKEKLAQTLQPVDRVVEVGIARPVHKDQGKT